jgi:hypothetical protein
MPPTFKVDEELNTQQMRKSFNHKGTKVRKHKYANLKKRAFLW